MDEAAQEVQQLDLPTYAVLYATKAGTGPAARVEFLAEAGERFAVPVSALQTAWEEAAKKVRQGH